MMNINYDMVDSESLKSKIISHSMCYMLEETDYTFAVIFHERKRKNDVYGIKASKGLGRIKALEKLLEKIDRYITQN